MGLLLLAGRLLLAAIFAVAAIGKITDRAGSRKSMAGFGVPEWLVPLFVWFLPASELACALALLPVQSAWYGAAGVLALLLLFSAAIGFNLIRGRAPECHCFGQLHSAPIGWKTLVRNTLLSAIAGAVLWGGRESSGSSISAWVGGWSGPVWAITFLAFVAVFQMWLWLHLLRQNGRLLLRLEAVESRLGIDPAVPAAAAGLPLNSAAPPFALPSLNGPTVTLEQLVALDKPVLLVFTEPNCGACEDLAPDLAEWQTRHAQRLSIVLISRGVEEVNRAKAAQYQLRNVLLQGEKETSSAYLVAGTPTGVLVINGKVASVPAAGTDEIRALVASATLPPPVNVGDAAPSLPLIDLDGKSVDLASSRGRHTLLLFWSPSCGYCQRMLEDVKRWERRPPAGAPALVIISSGSAGENLAQGFRSTVLLDQHFAAGRVFGAGGTPAAVLLDERGNVVSEIRTGIDSVVAILTAPVREVVA